jgi:Peptidase C39 family
VLGGVFGNWLAIQGITAENALTRHQRSMYFCLLGLLGAAIPVFLGVYLNRSGWIPVEVLLYLGEYTKLGMFAISVFIITFFIFLERRHLNHLRRQIKFLGVILTMILPLVWLVHQLLPITDLVGPPKTRGVVVLQTTPYTCTPASIATLMRALNPGSTHSEWMMTVLARTNRSGTSTLAALRTLQSLGLSPRFERNLALDDLIAQRGPALLHVNEPDADRTIRHTVTLLDISPIDRQVLIANPLYGLQIKTFEEMKTYWLKEAIFVSAH